MCAWGKPKESSFTTKLSRMVGDLKRKHKTIAAHRALLLDLISAPPSPTIGPLFPFLSSRIPSQSPLPHHFTSHTSPPISLTRSPLHYTTFVPSGTAHSPPPHIHGSCSALDTPQESPSRSIGTTHSPLLHIRASRSVPITPEESPLRSIAPPYIAEKKALPLSSSEKKALPSNPSLTSSPPAAPYGHRSKHLAQHTLWATSLLALLCTFLCLSKEIALAVTVAAHLTLWLALRLGLLARGSPAITINQTVLDSMYQQEEDRRATKHGHKKLLSRSLTIPRPRGATFLTSAQSSRRSKSWTKLHSSVQEEGQGSMEGDAEDLPSSKCARIELPQWGKVAAKLKLQVLLIFALCGLFHGRVLAVCMAICCILIHSTMESLFLKRRT